MIKVTSVSGLQPQSTTRIQKQQKYQHKTQPDAKAGTISTQIIQIKHNNGDGFI